MVEGKVILNSSLGSTRGPRSLQWVAPTENKRDSDGNPNPAFATGSATLDAGLPDGFPFQHCTEGTMGVDSHQKAILVNHFKVVLGMIQRSWESQALGHVQSQVMAM